jgi:hypothetical protein
MAIAAILATVAFLSYQPSDIKARYQAERLRSDLRHTQMLAMTWGVTLRMTTAASSYTVSCATATTGPCPAVLGNPVTDPATGQNFTVAIEPGFALAPAATFDLDALGRPRDSLGALLAGDTAFTVTAGATIYTVTVRPLTGFALVTP